MSIFQGQNIRNVKVSLLKELCDLRRKLKKETKKRKMKENEQEDLNKTHIETLNELHKKVNRII
jgi:hypothetical protein